MYSTATEEQIVAQVKQGDERAMRWIYDRYSSWLFGVCRRYITDDDDACDVLQEAFVRIFRNITQFTYRGDGALKAWMTRITINESMRALKQQSRRQETVIPDNFPDCTDDEEESEMDVMSIPQEVLLEAIRNLPDGYRSVFNMYLFEEMSHKEIAAQLGISEGSSASQYHRAKKAIKRQLLQYLRER